MWDPEQPNRLHVVCEGGKYSQYTWSWATHASQEALVAVLDGCKCYKLTLKTFKLHKHIFCDPLFFKVMALFS